MFFREGPDSRPCVPDCAREITYDTALCTTAGLPDMVWRSWRDRYGPGEASIPEMVHVTWSHEPEVPDEA